jgi:hypothetical protein
MKLFAGIPIMVGLSLSLWAADPSSDALNRWVGGKWVSSGAFVASAYSQASKATAVTKCVWSPDHIFVVCDQDIVFAGTPMRNLSVYTFAPKTGKFYFYGFSLGEDKPHTTALDITSNGERWTYSSSDEIKGTQVRFQTINQFHGNDAVDWWTEFSTDAGKTWTKTGEGKETREK